MSAHISLHPHLVVQDDETSEPGVCRVQGFLGKPWAGEMEKKKSVVICIQQVFFKVLNAKVQL